MLVNVSILLIIEYLISAIEADRLLTLIVSGHIQHFLIIGIGDQIAYEIN